MSHIGISRVTALMGDDDPIYVKRMLIIQIDKLILL